MATNQNSLVSWIGAVVRAQPARPALIQDQTVWTYRDLWRRSEAVARHLLGMGVDPRQSVGLIGANEPAFLVNYFGIMRAGMSAVPINAMLDAAAVKDQLNTVRAQRVIVGEVRPDIREALEGSFQVSPMAIEDLPEPGGRLPTLGPASPCAIMMTSGSTGRPKGAVHTQGTMLHAALQLAAAFPFAPNDRGLVFLPLYACIPEQVLPTLCTGGALEILPGFDVGQVAQACSRATTFDAVPTVLSRLIEHASPGMFTHLRWVLFASEIMPVPLLHRWWAEVPHLQLHQFYGMTELLALTAASDAMLRAAPTSVGRPFPTTGLRLGPDDISGKGGELLASSPARMRGYFDDPESTKSALCPDGALRTGDLGRIDETGLVYLTGRRKDLIISGGINIAPGEIEAVAHTHPAVERAIVVGVPSDRWGETPVVVAILKPGAHATARDILDYCRSSLTGYKRPSGAAIVDTLPVTGIGKITKAAVQQMIHTGEVDIVRL